MFARKKTRPHVFWPAARGSSRSCFKGDLQRWPLAELLQWLHVRQWTALVRVGRGLNAAVLFVDQGELIRAEWGDRRGWQALKALATGDASTFWVLRRDALPRVRANVSGPTPAVAKVVQGWTRHPRPPRRADGHRLQWAAA